MCYFPLAKRSVLILLFVHLKVMHSFSFVFLRSLWPHTSFTVVSQYLIVVFIYFFCYIIYIYIYNHILFFFFSGPLCLSISVSGYTKFVVSHHWHYQHSAQKFKRKLNNFLSSDQKKKKDVIYKAIPSAPGMALRTKTTFI